MSGLELLMAFENEGLETLEEVEQVAQYVWDTQLHRSCGTYTRFILHMFDSGWTPQNRSTQP